MNVIDATKSILNNYKRMKEFSKGIEIDHSDSLVEGVGLYSNGDTLIKEDVLGNQTRRANFILYSVSRGTTDMERLRNNGFLLELGYYLDKQKNIEITGRIEDKEYPGKITKIRSSNGMKYSVNTENKNFVYQIQVLVEYKLFTGEEK